MSAELYKPRLVRSISISVSSQKHQETCFAHSSAYLIVHNIYNIDLSEEDVQKYIEHNCNQYLDTTKDEPNLDDLNKCGETGKTRILLFLYIYLIITLKFGCNKGYVNHSIKYYLEGNYLPPFTSQRLNEEALSLVQHKDLNLYTETFLPIDKINVPYLKNIFDDGLYISLLIVNPSHVVTLIGMTETEFIGKDSYEAAVFRFPITQMKSTGTIVVNSNFVLQGVLGLNFLYKKSANYPYYTREFAIADLQYASPELKADKEVVMAAVTNNGNALQYASPELKADKEVVMATVTNNGFALRFASPELKADKEVVMVAVSKIGFALRFAPELQGDKEVVMAAVTNNGNALQFASPELQGNRKVVIAAMSKNSNALQFASKEVVMFAVTFDGNALQYVSPELKADKEVVMAAVSNNSNALPFASPELQEDKEVMAAAARDVHGGRKKRTRRNKKTKKYQTRR